MARSACASASLRAQAVAAFDSATSIAVSGDRCSFRPRLRRGRDNARTDRAPAPVSVCRRQRSGAAWLFAVRIQAARRNGRHRSDHQPLHGTVSRPHLFEVIELADLGRKIWTMTSPASISTQSHWGGPSTRDPAKAFVFEFLDDWSAMAPTCRCERPDATTIWSPIEVLPLRSMVRPLSPPWRHRACRARC